jgi:acetyltransferase-like isoleucine patch superfamily enzyme
VQNIESDTGFSLIDSVGKDSIIHQGVEILVENPQMDGRGVFIGSQCIIYPRNRLVLGDMAANPNANMTIGNHVLVNAGGYLSGEGGLTIGDYVLIGPNTCILSAGHRYEDPTMPIQRQGLTYGRIAIGRDVWIGGGAVVLQGVVIGEGAVVGAGTVVCGDVPPRAVVLGNPGRVIKYRGQGPNRPVLRMISELLKRLRRHMPVPRDM